MESSDPRVRSRLADLAGWSAGVPDPSAVGSSRESEDLRGRALGAALATYTAAHGHPLDHPSDGPRRWRTSPRVAAAVVLALAGLTAGVVVWRVAAEPPSTLVPTAAGAEERAGGAPWSESEAPLAGSDPADPASADPGDPAAPSSAQAEVVVHVVGQVVAPGLVELPAGSRVADAVTAAGGATPEAEMAGLNLARPLVDGEQIRVPDAAQAAAAALGGSHGAGTADGRLPPSGGPGTLDLNSADVAALDALAGIGPVLAERIVAWRDEHGRFTSVDELTEVSGIGPALLGRLRDQVHVG